MLLGIRRTALALLFGVALAACVNSVSDTAEDKVPSVSTSPDASVSTTLEPIRIEDLPDSDAWPPAFVECMTRKGFEASVLPDGNVFVDSPDEQFEASGQAMDECNQELVDAGLAPDPRRPPSEELLRFSYERAIGTVECLVENGYPVGEIPSWEAYLDMRTRGEEEEGPHWEPLGEVDKTGDSDLVHEAYALCVPTEFSP